MTVTAQRLSAQGLAGLGMGSQPGSFSPAFPAPAGTPINRRVLPPRSFRRWRAVPDRAEPAGPRGVNQANPNQARPAPARAAPAVSWPVPGQSGTW